VLELNLAVIGTGYVGLVTGTCFAKLGHNVACVDVDKSKVEMINNGIAPIYEQGLEEMLKQVVGKTLHATTDLKKAVAESDACFISVGTPSREDGSVDLKYVNMVAEQIGEVLDKEYTVVMKSTVVSGTSESVAKIIKEKSGQTIHMGMNPEFLKEGVAVQDFMNPDRLVFGADDEVALQTLRDVYSSFNVPVVETNTRTAEMVKYASNLFLPLKVTTVNELGNICKLANIDVYTVAKAVGMDSRIGPKFLMAGCGFGGSCFGKDLKALRAFAKSRGYDAKMITAALETNDKQPLKMVELAEKHFNLNGRIVSVLGLAFKSDTDDMRDSRAIPLINALLEKGCTVKAYDPKATENAQSIFGDKITYGTSAKEAINNTEVCFVVTDWPEFKNQDLYQSVFVVDGRNVVRKKENYEGICW